MLQVHHHLRDNDATQSAARELGACWRPASTPDGLLRSEAGHMLQGGTAKRTETSAVWLRARFFLNMFPHHRLTTCSLAPSQRAQGL
jgi:hypothetical protein